MGFRPRRLGWALAALVPLLALAAVAQADLESKMRAWVQGGGALHLNDPSSYRAQGRSYISGGSMLYRVPSSSNSLAGFRAPHFSVGCGGIDIYGGSFNLIEADQFITILEETVQNAEVFFIDLALRTVSPQIANTMEKVYGWLEKLNEISIDSCQTGRALANALFPQQEEASMETECIRVKQLQPDPAQPNRLGLSYADASEACKSGRASALEGEETTAFVEGNLTWNAIEEVGLFADDDDFKEILMSILGTIVKRYEDASGTPVAAATADGDANSGKNVDFYESKLITDEDSLLDALRFGGSAEVYQCRAFAGLHTRYRSGGQPTCLDIGRRIVTVRPQDSLTERISDMIGDLMDAIRNRQDPSEEDFRIINRWPVPLQRTAILAVAHGGSSAVFIGRYRDVMTNWVLVEWLENVVAKVEEYIRSQPDWLSDKAVQALADNLIAVGGRIQSLEARANERLRTLREFDVQQRALDQDLFVNLPTSLRNAYEF